MYKVLAYDKKTKRPQLIDSKKTMIDAINIRKHKRNIPKWKNHDIKIYEFTMLVDEELLDMVEAYNNKVA